MSERDREPTRLPREEFDAQLRHAGEAALGDASLIADEEREAVLARMFGEGARERRIEGLTFFLDADVGDPDRFASMMIPGLP